MNGTEIPRRENEAPRDRTSRLSAAMLRISASLDVDTVLNEIAEIARALTGARGAVITAFDHTGKIDYVTSGLTADQERELIEWPDGLRLFEHLRNLPSPLRLPDLPAYVRSLGFSTEVISVDTFLATSIRHRNVQAGSVFVGAKEGGQEFTKEDEEILALFAAQAATAIANARAHRDEQRARADLEALIDTSPVGVVVIDAKTAHLVSLNREARRIVAGLLDPGQTVEELLQVVTYRLADGQEVALDEFPLTTVLSNAAPLRAEEVVLSVPVTGLLLRQWPGPLRPARRPAMPLPLCLAVVDPDGQSLRPVRDEMEWGLEAKVTYVVRTACTCTPMSTPAGATG